MVSELTWQHNIYGPHRVFIFMLAPLSFLSQFLKTPVCCSCFYRSNSNFWVLSDGNKCWKSSQTQNFWSDSHVLRTQLWKLSDMIQKHTHPNRLLGFFNTSRVWIIFISYPSNSSNTISYPIRFYAWRIRYYPDQLSRVE